jgi:peptidoglycan/xylan/chitin deacetylase (PgdA/CDA1 family)
MPQVAGVALAAHGVDHVRWTNLPDAVLARTIEESAAWLRSLAPDAPLALAYPDAAFDARVARAAAEAGFSLGFGLATTPAGVPDRLGIARQIAQDDPMWIEHLAASLEPGAR